MSYPNNGLSELGRGSREVIRNTAREAAKIAINGGIGALVLGALWMVAILLAGWPAVYIGSLGIVATFAIMSLRAAIKAISKERRAGFIASFVISAGAIVAMVVMRDELRSYWPVPEIEAIEYPAAAEYTYEGLEDCVYENGYPAAGCVMTTPLGVLTAKDGTLFVDGMPRAPIRTGEHSDDAAVIFTVDGAPINIPVTPGILSMSKRARGGIAIFAVFTVFGIVVASGVDIAFITSSIAETLNKNAPPTPQQAPWYAPPLFWIEGIFNRGFRGRLRDHALRDIGAVSVTPQAPQTIIQKEIWIVDESGASTVSPNGSVAMSPMKSAPPQRLAALSPHLANEGYLRKLGEALNNPKTNFSQSTGMRCGWSDDDWADIVQEMVAQGLAIKANKRTYKLTPRGEKYLSLYGYILKPSPTP